MHHTIHTVNFTCKVKKSHSLCIKTTKKTYKMYACALGLYYLLLRDLQRNRINRKNGRHIFHVLLGLLQDSYSETVYNLHILNTRAGGPCSCSDKNVEAAEQDTQGCGSSPKSKTWKLTRGSLVQVSTGNLKKLGTWK